MERWLADPTLLRADPGAGYARDHRHRRDRHHRAAPRLPQRSRRHPAPLGGRRSRHRRSLHRIVHDQHRALPGRREAARRRHGAGARSRLWIAPPTKMDQAQLREEGYYSILRRRRRPHRGPGLLAVHGQPGPGRSPARPWCRPPPATSRTAWDRMPTCSSPPPNWPPWPPSRAGCPSVEEYFDPRGDDRHHGRRHLPLPGVRQASGLRRHGRGPT